MEMEVAFKNTHSMACSNMDAAIVGVISDSYRKWISFFLGLGVSKLFSCLLLNFYPLDAAWTIHGIIDLNEFFGI